MNNSYEYNYSLSELIKSSAKQLVYYKLRKKYFAENKKPTEKQKEGVRHQELITSSKFKEMRGTYESASYLIHFSFDEIKPKKNKIVFIEHKFIDDFKNLEQWYIDYSILQVAVYQAFAQNIEIFRTASFYKKLGNEAKVLDTLGMKRKFKLVLANEKQKRTYIIYVKEPKPLIDFYLSKIESILVDNKTKQQAYDTAERFDIKFKRKEIELLSKYYTYKEKEFQ